MRRARIVCGNTFSPNRGYGETPDPDELILNCYRLADRFHQAPDVFLSKPISSIDRDMYYLVKLIDAQHAARGGVDDDDD